MADEQEIREALKYIDPVTCDYQTWCEIGMAIKASGAPCSLWDEWSRKDPKRYDGGCWKKWDTFNSSGITENTLFSYGKMKDQAVSCRMAKQLMFLIITELSKRI